MKGTIVPYLWRGWFVPEVAQNFACRIPRLLLFLFTTATVSTASHPLVGLYGVGVRELQIHGRFGSPLPYADMVARALGPMLEKVGAQPKIIQDAFLVSVCSKLKWISACPGSHGYADSSDQFAEFLTSFGNRLEFTSIMSANCTAPWVQRIVN